MLTGFVGSFLCRGVPGGIRRCRVSRTPQLGGLAWDFTTCGVSPSSAARRDSCRTPRPIARVSQFPRGCASDVRRKRGGDAGAVGCCGRGWHSTLLPCLVRRSLRAVPWSDLRGHGSHAEKFSWGQQACRRDLAHPDEKVLSLVVLRLFFPYGPGQTGRLIPEIIRRVTSGSPVEVDLDGEGLQISPTHVEDVCDAIVAAIETPWNGTINVARPR